MNFTFQDPVCNRAKFLDLSEKSWYFTSNNEYKIHIEEKSNNTKGLDDKKGSQQIFYFEKTFNEGKLYGWYFISDLCILDFVADSSIRTRMRTDIFKPDFGTKSSFAEKLL